MREPHREDPERRGRRGAPGVARSRGGRPPGATRERILNIALDLFTEHGYDKTSLREIAEELGLTKAAVYYHFERKEDILLALHLRMHALGHDVIQRLRDVDAGPASLEQWAGLLDQFIDAVLANRKLFMFQARNQSALEIISRSEHHMAEHQDMEEQLRRFLASPAIPVNLRVRMACSIGAVMGSLMESEAFADVDAEELAGYVRDAVRDLLGIGRDLLRSRGTRPRRSVLR
jgi:AcrR family transcriptional regulator